MRKFFALLMLTSLLACQEEINEVGTPNPTPNPNPNPNPGSGIDCNFTAFTPVAGKYANCLPQLSSESLDIVTWNIENFAKGSQTIALTAEIINTWQPDVIAVQEISNTTEFNQLMASLPGYSSMLGGGSLRLGYIYKTSEITATPITFLFQGESCAFPRPAPATTITHVSGKVVTLINVHLKCCDDSSQTCGSSIERRRSAATLIKNYIDQNLPNSPVIVLGDYNEDLTEPEGNGVFTDLKNDTNNYRFTDLSIASCGTTYFSYQPPNSQFLSHLDHILITNELFDAHTETRTLRIQPCESQYFSQVSDHYPVMARFE